MSKAAEVFARLAAEDLAGNDKPETSEAAVDPAEAAADIPASEGDAAVASDAPGDKEPVPLDPKKDELSKPKAEDPRMAAQFAALARKKGKLVEREGDFEAKVAAHKQREEAFSNATQRFNADVQRFRADQDKLTRALTDKSTFFEYAERAGISPEDVIEWAKGSNRGPSRKDGPKPLTQEDLDRAIQQKQHEWEQAQRAREGEFTKREAEQAFLKLSGDEAEYEAANLIYSDAEKVRLGHEIADAAASRGLRWGMKEVAAALNEHAESDPRYAKMKARLDAQAAGAAKPSKGAGTVKPEGTRIAGTHTQERPVLNGESPRRKHDDRLRGVLKSLPD